jgi:hypothetical protein
MHAYGKATTASGASSKAQPSEELSVAVTFPRPDGKPGLTKFDAPISPATVRGFTPDPLAVDHALYDLARLGFRISKRGNMSVSMRCTRAQYEQAFGTKLSRINLDLKQDYSRHSFYFPAAGAQWSPSASLANLIDDAYIQWPHIYMARRAQAVSKKAPTKPGRLRAQAAAAGPSATPPHVNYHHLNVPHDVTSLLDADRVHRAGVTGRGIRVAMVDSGFAHTLHPYFAARGYRSTVDLAPGATNDKTDRNGHGTGESANVFAMAPGATFIGIKVDSDDPNRPGASMLEGFQTAMESRPHIISISMGYDLRDEFTRKQMSVLPSSLAALEAEIQAAIAQGVIVVFSAGNGHFAFPGMMPEVISVGGVFIDEAGTSKASDYASAFASMIYPGRNVPDVCGLVGMQPHASYIMLPIPAGCEIDGETSQPDDGHGDQTTTSDGWGVFSGTSAAAPQLAGVCALLLEKSPGLRPSEMKALLRRSARDVVTGAANGASADPGMPAMKAGPGDDGATGAGIVDAFEAFRQL